MWTQWCDSRHKPILLILSFVHNLDSVNINSTAGITCFYLKVNIKVLSALHSINSVWHIFFLWLQLFEITNVIVTQAEESHLKYDGDIFPLWCHLTDLSQLNIVKDI